MRFGKGLLASLAGGLLFVGTARDAGANSITVTIGYPSIANLGGGLYEWSYGATLSAGSEISQGSFFEIVDFGQVFGVTPSGANWTSSLQATSQVPGANIALGFVGRSDTAATNVLFTYFGPEIGSATMPTDLGLFKIISNTDVMAKGAIIGNDYVYVAGAGVGEAQSNFGPTSVPGKAVAVPLPSAAWGGMALCGLVAAARLRKAMKR